MTDQEAERVKLALKDATMMFDKLSEQLVGLPISTVSFVIGLFVLDGERKSPGSMTSGIEIIKLLADDGYLSCEELKVGAMR